MMQDDPLYDDDLLDDDHYDGESGSDSSGPSFANSRADQLVDDLMPEGFDWRHVVTTYPRSALAAAIVGGFLVGRAQGIGLLTALSGYFVGEVTRNVQGFVDDLTGS